MTKLPILLLVIGVAGSGKSEVGKKISKEVQYTYLDKDTISRGFTESLLMNCSPTKDPNDRESDYYLQHIRDLEYAVTLEIAIENLRLGNDVLISAPFLKEAKDVDWLNGLLRKFRLKNKVKLKVVLVESDRVTERKRIIQRDAARDLWKLGNWEVYVESLKDFKVNWETDFYVFDNKESPNKPFSEQIDEVKLWLEN